MKAIPVCLVIVLTLIIQETCGECPSGWQHFEGKCYFFSTTTLPWHSAFRTCRSKGAELASIQSEAENKYLEYFARAFNHDFWVGGNDEIIEGQWTWAGTDEPFTFTDWSTATEPQGGIAENCMVLHHDRGYHWADFACTYSGFHYICEKRYPGSEGGTN